MVQRHKLSTAGIAEGRIKPSCRKDAEGSPELNKLGVPLARSFAKTEEQRQISICTTARRRSAAVCRGDGNAGRPRRALRTAFMATMKDPDLVGEANKMQVDADPSPARNCRRKSSASFATLRTSSRRRARVSD